MTTPKSVWTKTRATIQPKKIRTLAQRRNYFDPTLMVIKTIRTSQIAKIGEVKRCSLQEIENDPPTIPETL